MPCIIAQLYNGALVETPGATYTVWYLMWVAFALGMRAVYDFDTQLSLCPIK